MRFTEPEVRFLLAAHPREHATSHRELGTMTDMRELGCPLPLFERILEDRARTLGRRFTEFRASLTPAKLPVDSDLDVRVAASGLF
jgi:hypothetical protein